MVVINLWLWDLNVQILILMINNSWMEKGYSREYYYVNLLKSIKKVVFGICLKCNVYIFI